MLGLFLLSWRNYHAYQTIILQNLNQKQNIQLPEGSLGKQTTTMNLGPTHPATHGVFQNILEMDGERIVSAVPTVDYIHRAFEKLS